VSKKLIRWHDEKRETYDISNTPGGEGDTLGLGQAGIDNSGVVVGRSTSNIELSDRDVETSAGKSSESSGGTTSTSGLYGPISLYKKLGMHLQCTYVKMHLCTDTVDDVTSSIHTLDEGNHSLGLCIVGVEVVVVNVEPVVNNR